MKKNYLSDDDHVVRHCVFSVLIRENGKIIGVFPQAFELRPGEQYLSASWLEFQGKSKEERIALSILNIGKAREVKRSHGLAIGNVGQVKNACASFGQKIRIVHEPSKNNPNPAYTAIRQFNSSDLELLELLAGDVWSEVVSAADFF